MMGVARATTNIAEWSMFLKRLTFCLAMHLRDDEAAWNAGREFVEHKAKAHKRLYTQYFFYTA